MPRGKKFTAEQIRGKLREAEVGLAQGKTVAACQRITSGRQVPGAARGANGAAWPGRGGPPGS
ncbi:MAG: hypothetical protein RLZZ440_652 [Planctomycetota bacterium]